MIKSKNLIAKIERPAPDTQVRTEIYRLEKNERTTLFSSKEFESMMNTITPFDLVAYGELEPFYQVVIKNLNIKRNNILITAGSDLGIKAVFETFIEEGDEIINYHPNYAMFSVYAKMFGAKEIQKSYNENLVIDLDSLFNSIHKSTKMVVISNPGHNGVTIPEQDLITLLEKTKNTQTIILVDEAYVDFSTVDMLKHIEEYKNLLIVRTMSKAYGVAALRIGFLLACEELISELYKVKPVHEIDGIAAKIGKFLFENQQIKNDYVSEISESKKMLYLRLNEMDIKVLKSDTNFVYFKLKNEIDANAVFEKLKSKNIYIKLPFKGEPFDGFLRTTVGSATQMNYLCDSINEILIDFNK